MPSAHDTASLSPPGAGGALRAALVRNTAWNYVGFVVNLLTNMVAFPVVVRHLGDAAAGVWLLVASLTGYMGLLHMGIVPALSQFVAANVAAGEHDQINRRSSTALALLLGLGALSLAAMPFTTSAVRWFHVPAALQGDAAAAFALGIVSFSLQLPGHVFNALLNGALRQDRCNQIWILSNALKAAGSIAIVVSGYGLIALLSFDLALIVAIGTALGVAAYRAVPSLRLSPALVGSHEARDLTRFGGLLLVGSLSRLAVEQTDRIVIGAFLSVALVTYYSAAWKIYMLAYALPTTLLAAVTPTAGALYGVGDRDGLRRLFLRMTKYGLAASWPVALSLAGCASVVLRWWMGPGFEVHARVVQVLLAALLVMAHNHAGFSVLIGMREVRYVTWAYSLPQAILNVTLSVLLVRRLELVGVALGTLIPLVLLEYVFLAHVLGRLHVGWPEFLKQAIVPTAVPALICFVPLALGYAWWGSSSTSLPAVAVICSVAYAGWFWWWSLDRTERRELLAHVPGLRPGWA
jgi:O-antigen/teichoic acid export membrane protein